MLNDVLWNTLLVPPNKSTSWLEFSQVYVALKFALYKVADCRFKQQKQPQEVFYRFSPFLENTPGILLVNGLHLDVNLWNHSILEAKPWPGQTSKMESFATIVNG